MNTSTFPYKRIAIIGTTGSGKTTLAGEISALLDISVYSLDILQKDEDGHKIDSLDFLKRVEEIASADSWILDGGYKITNPIVFKNAQAVIWLDYPLRIVLPRRIRRNLSLRSPYSSLAPKTFVHRFGNFSQLVRITIRKHRHLKKTYKSLPEDYPHLQIFHFTHPYQKQLWMEVLQQ